MQGPGAKSWLLSVIALGVLAAQPFMAADAAADAVKKQLAGEWTLVKYEVFPENGPARPGNYDVGRINYGEREMSAHLMRTDRPAEPQNYLGLLRPVHRRHRQEDRRAPRGRIVAAHLDRHRAGAALRVLGRRQSVDAVTQEWRTDYADAHVGAHPSIGIAQLLRCFQRYFGAGGFTNLIPFSTAASDGRSAAPGGKFPFFSRYAITSTV